MITAPISEDQPAQNKSALSKPVVSSLVKSATKITSAFGLERLRITVYADVQVLMGVLHWMFEHSYCPESCCWWLMLTVQKGLPECNDSMRWLDSIHVIFGHEGLLGLTSPEIGPHSQPKSGRRDSIPPIR